MHGTARGRALLDIQGAICMNGMASGQSPSGHTGAYLYAWDGKGAEPYWPYRGLSICVRSQGAEP